MTPTIDRGDVASLHAQVLAELASPGDWWDAPSRRAAIEEAPRGALVRGVRSAARGAEPRSRRRTPRSHDPLSDAAVEVIHRVVNDPGRLTRRWADSQIAALGDAVYAELVAVTAIIVAIDMYARSIGDAPPELCEPVDGAPARERPDGTR